MKLFFVIFAVLELLTFSGVSHAQYEYSISDPTQGSSVFGSDREMEWGELNDDKDVHIQADYVVPGVGTGGYAGNFIVRAGGVIKQIGDNTFLCRGITNRSAFPSGRVATFCYEKGILDEDNNLLLDFSSHNYVNFIALAKDGQIGASEAVPGGMHAEVWIPSGSGYVKNDLHATIKSTLGFGPNYSTYVEQISSRNGIIGIAGRARQMWPIVDVIPFLLRISPSGAIQIKAFSASLTQGYSPDFSFFQNVSIDSEGNILAKYALIDFSFDYVAPGLAIFAADNSSSAGPVNIPRSGGGYPGGSDFGALQSTGIPGIYQAFGVFHRAGSDDFKWKKFVLSQNPTTHLFHAVQQESLNLMFPSVPGLMSAVWGDNGIFANPNTQGCVLVNGDMANPASPGGDQNRVLIVCPN